MHRLRSLSLTIGLTILAGGCASVQIDPAPVAAEPVTTPQFLARTRHFSNDPQPSRTKMMAAARKQCAEKAVVADEPYGLMGNWFMRFTCQ